MAEAARHEKLIIDAELAELRLLTEVEHLLRHMQPDLGVPAEVQADVLTNLSPAVCESAMPLAVTTTIHKVEYQQSSEGSHGRVISWMGRNAVQNALNGKLFHEAPAAHKRVDIEVAEAGHIQENLRAGMAQVFISPKMSVEDAPADIAKAEHLHDDDSIRVSYAIANSRGEIVARRLESLLVRDVPLEAWVTMLKDPHNLFGKAFDIKNENSALSVMKLFDQLELPEGVIQEGPVTLVASVMPYITDPARRFSVQRQLEGFRKDQLFYKEQAERTAKEWLKFELELAKSLRTGRATFEVKRLIAKMQHQWDEEALQTIYEHQRDGFEFVMSRKFAAMLEQAQRYLLVNSAALATNNERVILQLPEDDTQNLRSQILNLQMLRDNDFISHEEFARQQAEIDRKIASHDIHGGGGCPGDISANFRSPNSSDSGQENAQTDGPNKWKWKMGKCQVKSCPSPTPTEVGPCSVCRRCQAKFDAGDDPTKPSLIDSLFQIEKADTVIDKKNQAMLPEIEQADTASGTSPQKIAKLALAA